MRNRIGRGWFGVFAPGVLAFGALAFAMAGCDLRERTAEAAPANFEQGPRTEVDLVERYLAAHASHDVGKALELVCLDGVRDPQRTRTSYAEEFRRQFSLTVKRAYCASPRPRQHEEYDEGGTRMRSNLEVIGNLIVELRAEGEHDAATVSFPVGRKDGRVYLAAAAPVP